MRFAKTIMSVLAGSMLLAGTAASAAINKDAVHLALDSLLLASSKMSVINAMNANKKPPSTNAEAHLGAPSTMTTNEISGIVVGSGGVLNVYLSPATGTNRGLVQFTPRVVTTKKGKRAVEFGCASPNIPEIATIAPDCRYQASAAKP